MINLSKVHNASILRDQIASLRKTIKHVEDSKDFKVTSDAMPSYMLITNAKSVAKFKSLIVTGLQNRVLAARTELREMGFDPDK